LIDISCPRVAQQQTRRPPPLLAIDGMDRQMDARPLHRHCSAHYASSINNGLDSIKVDIIVVTAFNCFDAVWYKLMEMNNNIEILQ